MPDKSLPPQQSSLGERAAQSLANLKMKVNKLRGQFMIGTANLLMSSPGKAANNEVRTDNTKPDNAQAALVGTGAGVWFGKQWVRATRLFGATKTPPSKPGALSQAATALTAIAVGYVNSSDPQGADTAEAAANLVKSTNAGFHEGVNTERKVKPRTPRGSHAARVTRYTARAGRVVPATQTPGRVRGPGRQDNRRDAIRTHSTPRAAAARRR
ncbi:MAG: hypothetical protein HOQ05_03410 [Corynebacteriales bacterium]|nr:hypothetical protein [Mycobacteriales bacterium]